MTSRSPAAAIVAGGAGGIGSAVCTLLAERGFGVTVADLDQREAERVCADAAPPGSGFRMIPAPLDVRDESSWHSVIRLTRRRFGIPTVLVNCAGVISGMYGPEHTTEAEWNQSIDVNQRGTWIGIRSVAAAMRFAGGGAIVNVGSIYGVVGFEGAFAYAASKGAVRAMSRNAAVHYAKYNIRVNCVVPGIVQTPMTSDLGSSYLEQCQHAIPMGRLGDPIEVARPIVFLATDDASYITGAELVVDGGYVAK